MENERKVPGHGVPWKSQPVSNSGVISLQEGHYGIDCLGHSGREEGKYHKSALKYKLGNWKWE